METVVRLCGPLTVTLDGRPVELPGRQGRLVFAYLVLARPRAVRRDELVEALWPRGAPATANDTLTSVLSRLRGVLPEGALKGRGQLTLELPGARIDIEHGEVPEQPLLPEFADEPWVAERRRALEEDELGLLERRARAGDEKAARRLVERAPLRESGSALVMERLAANGDVAAALQVYEALRIRLRDQLGTVPAAHVRELAEHLLRQGRAPSAPAAPRLFGRDRDLAALAALLEHARLVTLTGPGGVGKTTLALALPDTAFVELAPVAESANVAAAIAEALDVAFEPGETARAALLRALGSRRLLLVLDNFEHVLDAAPLVAELLDACPRLQVVATSRAPLQLSAEQRYPVEPLREDAHDLFIARARARDPRFDPRGSAAAVATICRKLGGLPLAVELAAARIGFLEPEELARGLELDLLVGGARDRPDRQRTLRATLDWSHRLLTPAEQRAFAAFSAFAGGATLDAALHVTQAELPTLEALATNSLLTRAGGRLSMLEPVREYAAERLETATRRRHAEWCIELGRRTFKDLAHVTAPDDFAAFRADADNVRAALNWALGRGHGELALELVGATGQYWANTGQTAEGRQYVNAALTLAGRSAPPTLRARALVHRAKLWGREPGSIEGRVEDLEASLTLAGDEPRHVVYVLMRLSRAEFDRGDLKAAVARAEEALNAARALDDRALISRALAIRVAADPLHPEVADRTREAIRPLLRAGDVGDALSALIDVGYIAIADRRLAEARGLLEEAHALAASDRNRFYTSANLGLVYLLLGDGKAAAEALRSSLALARENSIEEIDEVLLALAAHAATSGELEAAARLAGAGQAHTPAVLRHYELRVNDLLEAEYLAPARARLGARRWDELQAAGARLGRAAAIALGLAAGE